MENGAVLKERRTKGCIIHYKMSVLMETHSNCAQYNDSKY